MAVRLDMAGTVALARWWWTFVVRGLLAIAFGVLAFFAPGLGIAVLVGLFAAWALIDGVTSLVTGIGGRNRAAAQSRILRLRSPGVRANILTYSSFDRPQGTTSSRLGMELTRPGWPRVPCRGG